MSAYYLSACHKSSGKTLLSIGLSRCLVKQGYKVQCFKKGPDYIDPIWHNTASHQPSYNLDFNTQTNQEITKLYQSHQIHSDIALIEGNKGLFDGVSIDGSDSNAALSQLLKIPVVLIIDCQGMTRGIAPLLQGYQHFDKKQNFAAVILNQVRGNRHEQKLLSAIQQYTDFKVWGVVQHNAQLNLEEQQQGLIPSNDLSNAEVKIEQISQIIKNSIDIHRFYSKSSSQLKQKPIFSPSSRNKKIRIGILEDDCFAFYYASDKQVFIDNGVELIPINSLQDKQLPANLQGLWIGGGFPERHLLALSNNLSLKEDIKLQITQGLPSYAECGGMMYLCRSIIDQNKSYPMTGIIDADVEICRKPQGRGLVKFCETDNMLWNPANNKLNLCNAHEFHYSRLINISDKLNFAYRIKRGVGITEQFDGIVIHNLLASYLHLRNSEQTPWVQRFINFVYKSS